MFRGRCKEWFYANASEGHLLQVDNPTLPNEPSRSRDLAGGGKTALEYIRLVEAKIRECAIQLKQEPKAGLDLQRTSDALDAQRRGSDVSVDPDALPRVYLFTATARILRELIATHLSDRRNAQMSVGHDDDLRLDEIAESFERESQHRFLAVCASLSKLSQEDASCASLIELRLFIGFTVEQIAFLTGVAPAHVCLNMRCALVKLYMALNASSSETRQCDFQRIDDLFLASLTLSGDERISFLNRECRGELDSLNQLKRMLAVDDMLQLEDGCFRCPFEADLRQWCRDTLEADPELDTKNKNLDQLLSYTKKEVSGDSQSTLEYVDSPRQAESEPAGSSPSTHDPSREELELDWSAPRIPGFEIIQEIGRGGMGVVYRAIDLRNGEVVALKTMLRTDSKMLARFKREFRSLSNLVHPNLAKLYELAICRGLPYFTMEYVPGRDFRTHVREGLHAEQPISGHHWQRLHSALIQLAEGVYALHAASKVHRDIKPSNILVTGSGRVVILDFGLAIELNFDGIYETINRHISGTPAFMSPEQRVAGPVTPASDWYSVGVVLYEAILGRLPPYTGTAATVRDIPSASPLSVAGVPSDIADLCLELLQFDPSQRPSGESVLRRIGTRRSIQVPNTKSRFVGRESQLQSLRNCFRTLQNHRSVAVLVRGLSGAGKSALIREFLDELRHDSDLLVLLGRCYKQETVPYKAVDELVDSLGRYLCTLTHEQCDAFLPRDTAALVRVFPTLQQVDAIRRAPSRGMPSFDQHELRQRAFAALRELLSRLGDRKKLVLVIDDLQWGDADSTALLNFVLRQPDGPVALFLGSFRSEDLESSDSLTSLVSELRDAEQVSLDSLSDEQSFQLAQSLLVDWTTDEDRNDVARRIAAESLGNPFFLRELVTGVIQGVSRSPDHECLTLEQLLWTRIQQLPAPMKSLLYTLATAGQPLQQEYASIAAKIEIASISEILKVLRNEHLIRDCGNEDELLIDTYHDRIREIVFSRLDADSQSECHRRLAESGEHRPRLDVKFLALHFRSAGEHEKAARYYVQAADEDAEKLAFNQAAHHYADALRLHTFADSVQLDVRTKMAAALSSDSRCVEAATEYLELAELEGANRLEMLRQAFNQYISIGRLDDGMSILTSALDLLGMKLPRTPGRALASLMFTRARLWLRGLNFELRNAKDIPPADLLRVDVLWSVAICLSTIDHIRGVVFSAKACVEALRVGEPGRLAACLGTEAIELACPGRVTVGRSTKMLKLANDVLLETDDPYVASQIRLCEGVWSGVLGDWDSCGSSCAEAERGSVANELLHCSAARFWRFMSLVWLGRLAELQEECPRVVSSAEVRGDLFEQVTSGAFPMSMVRLAQDKPDVALSELNNVMGKWTQRGFHVQHHLGITARASILLYQGRLVEAESELKRSWSAHKRSLLFFAQIVRVNLQHLRARIALQSIGGNSPYSNPVRVARKALRSLMKENRPWTTALAIAGQGSLAAKLGDAESGKRHLSKAANSFAALGMELYEAACSRHLGQLERGAFGRAKIEAADTWMTQQQRIIAPEKLAELLIPGSNTSNHPT